MGTCDIFLHPRTRHARLSPGIRPRSVDGEPTACTTSRLLPGLPPVCAGSARTDLPEKLHWLLRAHGTLQDLLLLLCDAASMVGWVG